LASGDRKQAALVIGKRAIRLCWRGGMIEPSPTLACLWGGRRGPTRTILEGQGDDNGQTSSREIHRHRRCLIPSNYTAILPLRRRVLLNDRVFFAFDGGAGADDHRADHKKSMSVRRSCPSPSLIVDDGNGKPVTGDRCLPFIIFRQHTGSWPAIRTGRAREVNINHRNCGG